MNVKDILNVANYNGVSTMLTNPAINMTGANLHTLNQYGVVFKDYTFKQRPDLLAVVLAIYNREKIDFSKYEILIQQALDQKLIMHNRSSKIPYAITSLGKKFATMNKTNIDSIPWMAGYLARI